MEFGNITPRADYLRRQVGKMSVDTEKLKKSYQFKPSTFSPPYVWRGIKIPSKHSMIKYICENYGVCGDLQELMEKNLVKNNMDKCTEEYKIEKYIKYRGGGVYIRGRDEVNLFRFWKTYPEIKFCQLGSPSIDRYKDDVNICGMKLDSFIPYNMKLDLDSITKKEMVEVMKNHGLKFNKSKKKSELWNIFIKSV